MYFQGLTQNVESNENYVCVELQAHGCFYPAAAAVSIFVSWKDFPVGI